MLLPGRKCGIPTFDPLASTRWGDYSAVALDAVSGNVWMADEYTFDQGPDPADNWGTRVWGLTG